MTPATYTSDARRSERERRLRILRRCDGMTREEIQDAYPGTWPRDDAGERKLSRDLAALRGMR